MSNEKIWAKVGMLGALLFTIAFWAVVIWIIAIIF